MRRAAPEAEECISYALPAFRHAGRVLVAFGASERHCAFYPMSGQTVAAFAGELARWETSKGAIRFVPERPLPATLVRRLVRARMEENAALPARAATVRKRPAAKRARTTAAKGSTSRRRP